MAGTGLRLVPVPGVGIVGIKGQESGADTNVRISGTEIDEETGRPTGGGGIGQVESMSRTYDKDSGGWKDEGTLQPHAKTGGKVKLQFVLDGSGRVKEWSTDAKKK